MGEQCHYKGNRLRRGALSVEDNPFRGRKGCVALRTDELFVLPRVDATVALA
jgi:hypothetical protein